MWTKIGNLRKNYQITLQILPFIKFYQKKVILEDVYKNVIVLIEEHGCNQTDRQTKISLYHSEYKLFDYIYINNFIPILRSVGYVQNCKGCYVH